MSELRTIIFIDDSLIDSDIILWPNLGDLQEQHPELFQSIDLLNRAIWSQL